MFDNEEKEEYQEKAATNLFRAYNQITTVFIILESFRRPGIFRETNSNSKKTKTKVK